MYASQAKFMHTLVIIMTVLLMLTGLVGSVVPVIPGPLLVLAGALLYAWHGDFLIVTWGVLGVLAALTAVSQVLDYAASIIGARVFGASRWGVLGACIGALTGFLLANIPGAVAGMFLGACTSELVRGRNMRESVRVGFGTLIGFLAGTAGKVLITVAMITIFVWQLF
jgi:uncharacterized protein YqgC (DUF456 family)